MDLVRGLSRKCQAGNEARDWLSLVQSCGKHGASQGASYGLSGVQGNRCCLQCWLILLQECQRHEGRRVMGPLWGLPFSGGESATSYNWEMGFQKAGINSLVLWTPATTGSMSWLAGVLSQAISSSWSPSHSRWAAYLFSLATSLSFHNAINKEKNLADVLRKINVGQRLEVQPCRALK